MVQESRLKTGNRFNVLIVSQPGLSAGSEGLGQSAAGAWGGLLLHKHVADGKNQLLWISATLFQLALSKRPEGELRMAPGPRVPHLSVVLT